LAENLNKDLWLCLSPARKLHLVSDGDGGTLQVHMMRQANEEVNAADGNAHIAELIESLIFKQH